MDPYKICSDFNKWIKSKKKKKYTFHEYFKKKSKNFRLRKMDIELRKKILDAIDGQATSDGRRIIVDRNKKIILIGQFDDL